MINNPISTINTTFNVLLYYSNSIQVKTPDFEIIGTNVHRDNNMDVAWNDAVEFVFKSSYILFSD